jgi:BMFP domain-containing protein YqiC
MSPKNISTPTKSPEISSRTHEENEEMHNKLSKLEDQLNDLSARSITSDELVNTQRKIQEMEKNMEQMENEMNESKEEIQKYIETILLQKIPNTDMKSIQGNHENKENKVVQTQSYMGSIFSYLERKKY